MDAHELFGVELSLKAADGLAQQVCFLARVDVDVVAFGFDPVNLVRVEEKDATACLNDKALAVARRLLYLFEQRNGAWRARLQP